MRAIADIPACPDTAGRRVKIIVYSRFINKVNTEREDSLKGVNGYEDVV